VKKQPVFPSNPFLFFFFFNVPFIFLLDIPSLFATKSWDRIPSPPAIIENYTLYAKSFVARWMAYLVDKLRVCKMQQPQRKQHSEWTVNILKTRETALPTECRPPLKDALLWTLYIAPCMQTIKLAAPAKIGFRSGWTVLLLVEECRDRLLRLTAYWLYDRGQLIESIGRMLYRRGPTTLSLTPGILPQRCLQPTLRP